MLRIFHVSLLRDPQYDIRYVEEPHLGAIERHTHVEENRQLPLMFLSRFP